MRSIGILPLAIACALVILPLSSQGSSSDPLALLEGAEERFVAPAESWFYESQNALRAEMKVVSDALEAQGNGLAGPWKEHFRWQLLEKNLGPLDQINLAEIELARRWMYSNRKGTELPFFARLRELTDLYLDAAYTLSQEDLQQQFSERVHLARQQIADLVADPTDANGAALGRTLGWFERTGQLMAEVEQLRAMLSHANGQVLVSKTLVDTIMAPHSAPVDHTLAVSDRGEAPATRWYQRPRGVTVRGTAHTLGTIRLELVPNEQIAEINILYDGEVNSHCHANAGPLSFNLRTFGPMSANKPVTFGPGGIEMAPTSVEPHVKTRVTSISADNNFVRRVGERRLSDPQNKSYLSSKAEAKAVELLEDEMDVRVAEAIDEIRAEILGLQSDTDEFREVVAPIQREGAEFEFLGTYSTSELIGVNIMAGRREQFGAPTPCPHDFADADVRMRIHVSMLNNTLETIMAGKTFTDEYFMKYAKVLQPTLPLDLMVHSRAPRWAIIAAKPRPLELRIPAPNQFEFLLHIASLEVDGERFSVPTTSTVRYELVENEFNEFYLRRSGEVRIESTLSEEHRTLLTKKLSAFFAPVLDGGGVIVPEGGSIGLLNSLKFLGVKADQDWLAIGIGVPKEFVEGVMNSRDEGAAKPVVPKLDETVLPPPLVADEDLDSYPTGL